MKKNICILLLLTLVTLMVCYTAVKQQKNIYAGVQDLERLKSLPYMTRTEEVANPNMSGVTLYNKNLAFEGYNLYDCGRLIDMDGKLVKSWPEKCHILMLEDLKFLAHDQNRVELCYWNSTLLWERNISAHHDVAETDEGTFLVLTREVHRYNNRDVEFDVVLELSRDGEDVYRWSTYEQRDYLTKMFNWHSPLDEPAKVYDPNCTRSEFGGCYEYFHFNSIQTLPENPLGKKDKRFQKGNWLISLLDFNTVTILDKDSKKVVWSWGEREIVGQHMPRMLETGNILVYDNDGLAINATRIIEIDPVKKEIAWQYMADPPQSFFSANMGSSQRLPNGNTLITESNTGRVFEVTKEGKTVWEWFNPNIDEEGKRETVYRMIRIPKEKIDITNLGVYHE